MTATAQPQPNSARRALRAPATAVTTALVLAAGLTGAGQAAAAPAADRTEATPACGAAAAGTVRTAATSPRAAQPAVHAAGSSAQKVSLRLPAQAPVALWSYSAVTVRTPVTKGSIQLDLASRGFSTDSLEVQRYNPKTHRWADLTGKSDGSSFPRHTTITVPVTTAAGARHPYTLALRLQDLDRPGSLTVTAAVNDGHGRTYLGPTRTTRVTRPAVTLTGWKSGTTLARGGAAHPFTVTVKNTTDRVYPSLNAAYFAYGQGSSHVLVPHHLVLQQYRPGHGWVRIPLVQSSCDPGMSAALKPAAQSLRPGATAVYRLRLAVAKSAPKDVTTADAGLSVGNGDASFFSAELPFKIH